MNVEEIKTVGVVGAGSMGRDHPGRGQAAIEVTAVDVDDAACARSAKAIAKISNVWSPRRRSPRNRRRRFSAGSLFDRRRHAQGGPFLFEAVFESVEVKKAIFSKLDAICGDEVVYATNTSSSRSPRWFLVKRPAKFVGMHFFNPVPVMKLVE